MFNVFSKAYRRKGYVCFEIFFLPTLFHSGNFTKVSLKKYCYGFSNFIIVCLYFFEFLKKKTFCPYFIDGQNLNVNTVKFFNLKNQLRLKNK